MREIERLTCAAEVWWGRFRFVIGEQAEVDVCNQIADHLYGAMLMLDPGSEARGAASWLIEILRARADLALDRRWADGN